MNGYFRLLVLVACKLIISLPCKAQEEYDLVQFKTDDGGLIEGAFFSAKSSKVVVFAHGAVFNKESWFFLNKEFQARNIPSLSIDFRGYGNSKKGSTQQKYYDIIGAIAYLNDQGFNDISIIGGSMGGAAILNALPLANESVKRVILLAPAGGPPIASDKIDKLFVISKDEGLYRQVKSTFNESSEPKRIVEFAGSTHAQHMFKKANADELVALILDFITKE